MQVMRQSFPYCLSYFLCHNHTRPDSWSRTVRSGIPADHSESRLLSFYNLSRRTLPREKLPSRRSSLRPCHQRLQAADIRPALYVRCEYGSFPDSALPDCHRSTRNYPHYYCGFFLYGMYMHIQSDKPYSVLSYTFKLSYDAKSSEAFCSFDAELSSVERFSSFLYSSARSRYFSPLLTYSLLSVSLS